MSKSIQNQTFTDFECILIDDGSTDESGEICDIIGQEDKRFIVIHQNNKGLSEARNTGLKIAKGNYIGFVDSDDYIHPNMYETLYYYITSNIEYSIAMIYGKKVYQNHKLEKNIATNVNVITQTYLFWNLYGRNNNEFQYQVVWNKLYRKDIITGEFFKSTGSEDTEFNNRIYLKTNKMIVIQQYLYGWLQRNTSITHQPINKNYISRMNSYDLCLNSIPQINKEIEALCLEKLYKTMINVRHHAFKSPYKEYCNNECKKLKEKTYNTFINNRHIGFIRKYSLIIFYYFPLTYNWFIKLCELKTKLL